MQWVHWVANFQKTFARQSLLLGVPYADNCFKFILHTSNHVCMKVVFFTQFVGLQCKVPAMVISENSITAYKVVHFKIEFWNKNLKRPPRKVHCWSDLQQQNLIWGPCSQIEENASVERNKSVARHHHTYLSCYNLLSGFSNLSHDLHNIILWNANMRLWISCRTDTSRASYDNFWN